MRPTYSTKAQYPPALTADPQFQSSSSKHARSAKKKTKTCRQAAARLYAKTANQGTSAAPSALNVRFVSITPKYCKNLNVVTYCALLVSMVLAAKFAQGLNLIKLKVLK